MLFSSSVFLFLFLPVVLLVYYLPLRRWRQGQNVFLLLASLGYIDGGIAPIVGDRGFDPLYINPIPSGLVLTGIVVSVSITAFSLALIQRIYRRYGTIEMRELLERAKKEDD